MFEAILFDMDGLFIDSEPDWHAAETEMMRGYGYDWQPADQLQCLGGPLARVTEYMSSCLNGSVKPETLAKVIIDEMQNRLSSTAAYMPGAIEFSKLNDNLKSILPRYQNLFSLRIHSSFKIEF